MNAPETSKLVAILAADVASYTRLMEADSAGTVAAWKAARENVIKPLMSKHSGEIVKLTGDGFLAIFSAAESAVNCAIAMQRELESNILQFRMGINLGDIMHDGEDIHGEGVNIAARLESIAENRGICISGIAYELVRNRVNVAFESLGELQLKNVSKPVAAYRIKLDTSNVIASTKSTAAPATQPLPRTGHDRPSIAVLPFKNQSSDPDQAFLADGLVEDVITSLSRFRWLFVISRNSTATLADQPHDARQIARTLGVRYIVVGTVRRSGERLRVSYELIDGETGGQVLAERLDRSMIDLFDLQDELTLAIVSAVVPEINAYEHSRLRSVASTNLTAWELYQRALAEYQNYQKQDIAKAKELTQKAMEADPALASAFALMVRIRLAWYFHSPAAEAATILAEVINLAERAVKCDVRSDDAHAAHGFALNVAGQQHEALLALERAITLNPNNAHCRLHFAMTLMTPETMRSAEALSHIQTAMLLSPADPFTWVFHSVACIACLQLGKIDEAARHLATYRNNPQVDWKSLLSGAVCEVLRSRDQAAKELIQLALSRADPLTLSLELAQRGTPQVFAIPQLSDACNQLVNLGLPRNS